MPTSPVVQTTPDGVIDFYFDFSSPYSYMAAERIDALAARWRHQVVWKPFLLGATFKETGSAPNTQQHPWKAGYALEDFARSARLAGLPYRHPTRFPQASHQAARAFLWLQQTTPDRAHDFAREIFRELFVRDGEINAISTLERLARPLGIDIDEMRDGIASEHVRQHLHDSTNEAIARQVFGAPMFFVGRQRLWGFDRLPHLEALLKELTDTAMSGTAGEAHAAEPSGSTSAGASPAGPWQGIVFDCDGVLVDSERITCGTLAEMITEQGHAMTTDEAMHRFIGKRIRDHLSDVESMVGHPLPPDWYDEFMERRNARLADRVEPMPGIRELLQALKDAGVPMAVASSADVRKMSVMLGRCDMLSFFDGHIFGSDHVEHAKPAPDVYLLAMRDLGIDPRRAIVIEDTPTGTKAGAAAGARVIGLSTWTSPDALRAAGAAETFASLARVHDHLRPWIEAHASGARR